MEISIKERLKKLADEKYRNFISGLIPNAGNILGVRMPLLRKLGMEIARGDWRGYLSSVVDEYHEEVLLRGIVIGFVKTDIEEKLRLVAGFVPRIDNWAVCDSFIASLKFVQKHKERVWEFLQPYFFSNEEYDLRFAVVTALYYFICEEYIDRVLELLDSIKHEGYYVKMAVAWALSACYAKFPAKTMKYLENNSLDDFTYNKTLQKIIESKMVDSETKEIFRSMKRHVKNVPDKMVYVEAGQDNPVQDELGQEALGHDNLWCNNLRQDDPGHENLGQDNPGQDGLKRARFAMGALVIYRGLLEDRLISSLYNLIACLDSDKADLDRFVELYGSLCHKLYDVGTGLKTYIIDKIVHTENPFALSAEKNGAACLSGQMAAAVKSDLDHLQIIASLKPDTIKKWIITSCKAVGWGKDAVLKLPRWINDDGYSPNHIKEILMKSGRWSDCAGELAEFHHRWGSGIFSKYRALVWKRVLKQGAPVGIFAGVEFPDPVRFSDLVSYEPEREAVIDNTLRFLEGYPANNMLLYGDRGTGKSTTVKALANEYYDRGLRIIEVPKQLLSDFPEIMSRLAGRNLKFIIFVDDLAFEDNEENYTALKAALEGGLASKPPNVLIYATSNRKHLIKERFSDRSGLASGNADDEVRASDTMQEKLSLSDRFGMTVIFSSPDKKRYLEIVEGIARNRGLRVDRDFLRQEALKWELRYNGRSPRTARQFVDWLEGRLAQ